MGDKIVKQSSVATSKEWARRFLVKGVDMWTDSWMSDLDLPVTIKVLDPDGWDRSDLYNSIKEEITAEEFMNRVLKSTCMFNRDSISKLKSLVETWS